MGEATGRELHGMGYTAAEYLPLSLRRRPGWYLAKYFARSDDQKRSLHQPTLGLSHIIL